MTICIEPMLHVFLGLRNASKCKKLIERIQRRLRLLDSRRSAVVRQLRLDTEQLLRSGHEQVALSRIEQLHGEENTLAVYELLHHFCQLILLNLKYVRRGNKVCPDQITEAVSSLVFASARCGDVPELRKIRKFFGKRYGESFATTAVELLPGNLVSIQLKEKLVLKRVSDDAKQRLLEEIIRDSFMCRGRFKLEYKPCLYSQDPQQTQKASTINGAVTSSWDNKSLALPCDIDHRSDTSSVSRRSPTLRGNDPTEEQNALKIVKYTNMSPAYCKFKDYQDEVEELRPPMKKDIYSQDQRVFVFKLSVKQVTEEPETGPKRLGSVRRLARRRLRQVSVFPEKGLREETGSETNHGRLYQNSRIEGTDQQRTYARGNKHGYPSCSQGKIPDCSLIGPCYLCTNDYKGDHYEVVASRRKRERGINVVNFHVREPRDDLVQCFCFEEGEKIMEMDYDALLTERNSTIPCVTKGKTAYHSHLPDDQQTAGMRSSSTGEASQPPYSRPVMSPVQNNSKNTTTLNMSSPSKSFPCEVSPISKPPASPSHVHPKLPDYDELAAYFKALKEAHRQNSSHIAARTSSAAY